MSTRYTNFTKVKVQWLLSCIIKVTGFQKTNQNVTLGLFHFIGPSNGYTHTLPFTVALPSLADWSAFPENFTDHVKSWLKQLGSWTALEERHGSEINHSFSKMALKLINFTELLVSYSLHWRHKWGNTFCTHKPGFLTHRVTFH